MASHLKPKHVALFLLNIIVVLTDSFICT